MEPMPSVEPVLDREPFAPSEGTNTWPIWVLALLPLLDLLFAAIPGLHGLTTRSGGRGASGLTVSVNLLLLVPEVLLAAADRRILLHRGVVRPLHWGWSLLDPVYVIGRAVVVRRRVRGSLLPLWLWVAASVLSTALTWHPR